MYYAFLSVKGFNFFFKSLVNSNILYYVVIAFLNFKRFFFNFGYFFMKFIFIKEKFNLQRKPFHAVSLPQISSSSLPFFAVKVCQENWRQTGQLKTNMKIEIKHENWNKIEIKHENCNKIWKLK